MNLNVFDLNLLRTLDALLKERSVSRAGLRLNLSQPATSGRLGVLRSHFNDPLLVRCGHEMELTPRAQALAGPVHELIRQMQLTLDAEPQFDPLSAKRNFRISVTDYVVTVLLRDVIAEARRDSPGLSFQIEPIVENSWDLLSSGEVDLCITTRPGPLLPGYVDTKNRFHHELAFDDDFVCLVDVDHPSVGNSITAEQLQALPHVIVRFGKNMRISDQMAWHTVGFEPAVVAAVPSFLAAAQLIPGTDMVTLIPKRLAFHVAKSLPVKYLESPIRFSKITEMMVWHSRSSGDPAQEYLRERVRGHSKCLTTDHG